MTAIRNLFRRLALLLNRGQFASDLQEEFAEHLDRKIRQNLEEGLPAAEARRRALLDFGNPALAQERTRREWGYALPESLLHDLRYAVRQLRRNPGFSVVVVMTLAFGIGANSAIFSVVNAVLLRSLPYKDPSHLVAVGSDTIEADDGISYKHYEAWKSQSRSYEGLAVYYRNSGWSRVTFTGEEPESAQGTYASANFFEVMGVAPALGRIFTADEEVRHELVLVLSDGLWKRRFGASSDVLGKTLEVNGQKFQVLGVMPATFQFPANNVQFWAPITTNPHWAKPPGPDSVHGTGADGFHWRWIAVGRLKPHISAQRARLELDTISRQWQDDPELKLHATTVLPLGIEIAPTERLALYVLLGAVGFVLMIACSNVANLTLARGGSRLREMAIRTALGASRRRLVRQLLTESMLLALISGCLGLLVAHFGAKALIRFGPADVPRLEQVDLDGTVLGFTLAVSLLAGILFGLAPALSISNRRPGEALQSGGRTGTGNIRRSRTSAALVAAEFALSVVLLSGAGLLIRSFMRLESVDPGFRTDHVLTLRVGLSGNNQFATHDELLQRLLEIPGVKAVGAIDELLPQSDPDFFGVRAIDGKEIEAWGKWTAPLAWNVVSGDVLFAMGIPLIKGRYFSPQDGPDSPPVVLIDERMAKRYWPEQEPIGQRLKGWDPRGHCTPSGCRDEWVTVIGVVGDVRRRGRERQPVPDIFQWYRQSLPGNPPPGDFVVRTTVDPEQLAPTLRKAVHDVDRTAVISGIATMESKLDEQVGPRRFQTWLLALFALVALLLAGIGIYGVMHYTVTQRTREMGIRMALGAQSSDVFKLVLVQGMVVTLCGSGLGMIAAWVVVRVLRSLLFGVRPTDPVTFLAVVATLAITTMIACYLPARRASKADPMVALRHE
ncbi:MAG TPA: ABC transporter permease [Candidatus Angelobacter sp.]